MPSLSVTGAAPLLAAVVILSHGPVGAGTEERRAAAISAPLPVPRPLAPSDPAPGARVDVPRRSDPATLAAAAACHASLVELGLRFAAVEAPAVDPSCTVEDPVRLESLRNGDTAVAWPDRPLVSCAFARVLARFTRDAVAPLATGLLGRPLRAFGTGGGFECRGRNRAPGAPISSHGRGLAVDVGWFAVEGRQERLSVAAPAGTADQRFVAAVRRAACGWFTTVLGPGSDAAHADHLHLDREPRGRTGEGRFCQ